MRKRTSRGGAAAFMRWTEAEDQAVRQVFAHGTLGERVRALCCELGRSPGAVYMRAIRIGAWKAVQP